MKKETGGSAYPHDAYIHPQNPTHHGNFSIGMTLRDWFAGQALNAILSSGEFAIESFPSPAKLLTNLSYEYADAMIESRKS